MYFRTFAQAVFGLSLLITTPCFAQEPWQARPIEPDRIRPDLVPVNWLSDYGAMGFCKLVENGPDKDKLLVRVKNIGKVRAERSVTAVYFHNEVTPRVATTIPLGPGEFIDLPISVPLGCFSPDCNFKIVVDFREKTPESREGNNTALGLCVG